MSLEIVWRNPLPPEKRETRIQRLMADDLRAVYVVCSPDINERFDLILGGAA